MTKGSRRCHVCSRQATGALVYRAYDYKIGRDRYQRAGAFLCQEDLEIATKANLERQVSVEDLILRAARAGSRV